MKKTHYIFTSLILVISNFIYGQTPQNVTIGEGKGESIWDSQSALIVVLVILVVIFISRNWSKNIHKKRDELSRLDKEDREKNEKSQKE